MPDNSQLDERFNRLEEKLRVTFQEIEKRMTQKPPQIDYEERIQELEDLLLLLQLENTKLKEKVGEGLDFGIVPAVPDISERLTRVESELASSHVPVSDERINELESKIKALPAASGEGNNTVDVSQEIENLEKRIKTLEALLEERGRKEIENYGILDDVQRILKGG